MRSQSHRSVTHLKKASAAFLSQPEVVLEVGIFPVVRPSAPFATVLKEAQDIVPRSSESPPAGGGH